jgi:hypothetical protein
MEIEKYYQVSAFYVLAEDKHQIVTNLIDVSVDLQEVLEPNDLDYAIKKIAATQFMYIFTDMENRTVDEIKDKFALSGDSVFFEEIKYQYKQNIINPTDTEYLDKYGMIASFDFISETAGFCRTWVFRDEHNIWLIGTNDNGLISRQSSALSIVILLMLSVTTLLSLFLIYRVNHTYYTIEEFNTENTSK